MADELLQRLGEALSRRKFIGRTGSAFLGATFAILGLPQPADAYVYCDRGCCHLCLCPINEPYPCYPRAPYCGWSWVCCKNGTKYRCNEWDCGGGPCNGGCINVNRSTFEVLGTC